MASNLRNDLTMRGARPDSDRASGKSEYGDVDAAARLLNLSKSFLNKARVSGSGPPYAKFGHAVRYHLPTLAAWAEAQTRSSTSDSGVA